MRPFFYILNRFIEKCWRQLTGSKSKSKYPWYDSFWLTSYVKIKKHLSLVYPNHEKLEQFESALAPFRTRNDFKVGTVKNVFSDETLQKAKELIKEIKDDLIEKHEWDEFGQYVVHDHIFFNELQLKLCNLVSNIVKEEVEPSYNFLSLYRSSGVCPIHLDSPTAKWTLDVCINSSVPWPIFVSDVIEWPEKFKKSRDWENEVKKKHSFEKVIINPGDGAIFSGSSQWHYREKFFSQNNDGYCDLIFFHFIPKGQAELSNPGNWAQLFEIPGLAKLTPFSQTQEP